uniref:Uncharacterized protein n=1 Tax=Tanacetum cinerariifolium TaxID=118510 RepID=A0A6L2NPS1_TANCI|nr:hypothetical protein [Tanacetum cinerariifolium]
MNVAQLKMTSFAKTVHSNVKRSFQRKSAVKNQPRFPRVSTVTEKIPTADLKFPTAKSTLTVDLGFENASKDLDNFLGSQRSDKNKEGLGYTAVPPPPVQIYSPPKKDLSWTG